MSDGGSERTTKGVRNNMRKRRYLLVLHGLGVRLLALCRRQGHTIAGLWLRLDSFLVALCVQFEPQRGVHVSIRYQFTSPE